MSSEFRICVLLYNAWKEILITCLGVTNGFEVVFQWWGFQFIWGRRLEQTALLLEDSGSGDAFINSVSCYLVLWKIICHFILCIKQVRQFGGYSLLPVTCCCVGMNSVAARSSTCPYKFKKNKTKWNHVMLHKYSWVLIITVTDVHHFQVYILTLKTLSLPWMYVHIHIRRQMDRAEISRLIQQSRLKGTQSSGSAFPERKSLDETT